MIIFTSNFYFWKIPHTQSYNNYLKAQMKERSSHKMSEQSFILKLNEIPEVMIQNVFFWAIIQKVGDNNSWHWFKAVTNLHPLVLLRHNHAGTLRFWCRNFHFLCLSFIYSPILRKMSVHASQFRVLIPIALILSLTNATFSDMLTTLLFPHSMTNSQTIF